MTDAGLAVEGAGVLTRRGRIVLAALLTAAGTGLLLVPVERLPDLDAALFAGLSVELVAHVALSVGAVALWAWALPGVPVAAVAAVGIGLALGTEALQALPFVRRSPEAADLAYNLAGIALGLAGVRVWRWVGRRRRSLRRPGG